MADTTTFVADATLTDGVAAGVPVLVVDENRAQRLALKAALRPLEYTIIEADSGHAALRCLMVQNFAVILIDVRMPIMDGFKTAALIRQRDQSKMTPIIFVTSHGRDEILNTNLYPAGAVDFIFAPAPPDQLRAKVKAFANLFVQAVELASQAREVSDRRAELERINEELTAIARQDPLTGLRNRRALQEDLELLEARVARYGHRYCMALFDVDHFKAYNDSYGHQAGDNVLHTVATEFRQHARRGDSLYRYGGEEFLCILPEQSLVSGSVVVERMRAEIQDLAIPHRENPLGVLTISAGLAVLEAERLRSATEVLKSADEALYRAKQRGRNRVEATEVSCGEPSTIEPSTIEPVDDAEPIAAADVLEPTAGTSDLLEGY